MAVVSKTACLFLLALAFALGVVIWDDASWEKIENSISRAHELGETALVAAREDSALDCLDRGVMTSKCYKTYYENFVTTHGVTAAFEDLKIRYEGSALVQGQCHQLTHAIGHAATILYDTPGKAFVYGDPFCWSGYYHGVMEQISENIGEDSLPSKLGTICEAIPGKDTYSFDYYNCVHGLGHGIMTVLDYDLFSSLALCKEVPGVWEQSACAGGAFMENIMVESRGGVSAYFKTDDPVYPCNSVDEEFKGQCFVMQTSHMLFVSDNDFSTVFNLCASVSEPYRTLCYQGIGREASGRSVSDSEKTRATCALGKDATARSQCISGAVKDFISYFHSDKEAKKLCNLLSGNDKISCLAVATEYYRTF